MNVFNYAIIQFCSVNTQTKPNMSSNILPDFVQELVNGFVNYSVNSKPKGEVDGFMSEIFWISITENGSDKRLDLMSKVAPFNEQFRKDNSVDSVFDSEGLFYDKFMPIFERFQAEKNVPRNDQFRSYPKCYGTRINAEYGQFAIILEDLRPQEFKMWDKSKPSPIENVLMVMREMGKFHGISYALKDQKPNEFAEFKKVKDSFVNMFDKDTASEWNNPIFERAIALLEIEEHKNIVKHIMDNYSTYLRDCTSSDGADSIGVLIHGDAWNNNILYQFNEQNIAKGIRFLDYQMIQYGSPAIDLLFNIFTSTDKALRDKEYDNIIKSYYESLSNTVKLLGSNPDKLFTFDNLQNELKRCGNIVLLIGPMMMEVSQGCYDGTQSLDEIANAGDGGFRMNDSARRVYALRLNEVFEDLTRLGYYHRVN